MLILTGNGDVLEPEGGIAAIGSGGNYALSAARALADYEDDPEVDRPPGNGSRRRSLRLHQRPADGRNHLRTMDDLNDRLSQSHRPRPRTNTSSARPKPSGRRGGAAQPLAPPAPVRRLARRGHAEEHPDDRPDRRRAGPIHAALAKLADAPFVKVEATKFTEGLCRSRRRADDTRLCSRPGSPSLPGGAAPRNVERKTHADAERRVLDALVGSGDTPATASVPAQAQGGRLDSKEIEVQVAGCAAACRPCSGRARRVQLG